MTDHLLPVIYKSLECKTMANQPFVSIVINNYNYAQFLSEAIDSAIEQTYSNIEVIVVDDCSTDCSREIIASYKNQILPILHTTNGQQGKAFNSGFAQSKGNIILFLDADDFLRPNAVEQIVNKWKPEISKVIAKVHYRLEVVDSSSTSRGFSYPQGSELSNGNIRQSILEVGTYTGVPTSGNALSRQALSQVMPIPASFATTADDYLSVLIPLYGDAVAIEESLGCYQSTPVISGAMTEITAIASTVSSATTYSAAS